METVIKKPEAAAPVSGMPLETPCEKCAGKGQVETAAWVFWNNAFARAVASGKTTKAATEIAGPYPDGPETHPCTKCEGRGSFPTPAGEALLAFLERHLGRHGGGNGK